MSPCGIQTHSPSKRAPADPRLRLLCYWDQHCVHSPLYVLHQSVSYPVVSVP